jgi:glutathione peroxidase-family protein
MAKDEIKRLKPTALKADEEAYTALKTINDYKPSNGKFNLANGEAKYVDKESKTDQEVIAEKAWKTARDEANDAQWGFHNYMLGAKDQVLAQFGADSNELQLLGLKKKSEYKRPGKRKG